MLGIVQMYSVRQEKNRNITLKVDLKFYQK